MNSFNLILACAIGVVVIMGVYLIAKSEPETTNFEQSARAVIERYEEPAILLHRPYPVPSDLKTRSHLGGLPQLPADVEWPRGTVEAYDLPSKDGKPQFRKTPLHFLAQIDCADLPESQTLLPKKGMLFFFANIDETMEWADGGDREQFRVIYAENVPMDQPTRSAPADLKPIEGKHEYSEYGYMGIGRWRRQDSDGKIYPVWPIELFDVMSYPASSALYDAQVFVDDDYRVVDAFFEAYKKVSLEKMSEHLLELSGIQRDLEAQSSWRDRFRGKNGFYSRLVEYPGADSFPDSWRVINEVSLYIGHAAQNSLEEFRLRIERQKQYTLYAIDDAQAEEDWEKVEEKKAILERLKRGDVSDFERLKKVEPTNSASKHKISSEALEWVIRAEAMNLNSAPDEDDRKEFCQWLTKLNGEAGLDNSLTTYVRHAMIRVVAYWTASGSRSENISDEYYYHFFSGNHRLGQFHESKVASYYPYSHQMLGHFPSSQYPKSVTDDTVGLLHLHSDDGIEFSFGDVGEIQFFIRPDDLENKRFDRAWAIMNGG